MKLKVKKVLVVSEDVTEPLARFNQAFNQLNEDLLDRTTEVDCLKMCLVTKSHLMLDGPHGTAKSQLATMAFSRVTGARTYSKQFMKGTQTDEIFGPMLTEDYKRGVWRHNIEGMLPTAHFADLDEVYRASDMALPSMMGILNERIFMNGGERVVCPLITAIGTTNFVTSSKELDAFHDRWLVKVKVLPLTSPSLRIKMLLNSVSRAERAAVKTCSLEDIQVLQTAIRYTEVEPDTMTLLEEIVTGFRKKLANVYISDRRLVQALQLCRAAAVLNAEDGSVPSVGPEHLPAAQYALCTVNDETETSVFTEVVGQVTGNFAAHRKENKEYADLMRFVSDIDAEVTKASGNEKRLSALAKKVTFALSGLTNMSSEEMPTLAYNAEKLVQAREQLSGILAAIDNKNTEPSK